MSSRNSYARRILRTLVPLALIAMMMPTSTLQGQGDDELPLVAVEPASILLSSSVSVLGDGFLAAPMIAPISNTPCYTSSNGPVERAAQASPDSIVEVDNEACVGATLSDVTRQQLPSVSDETQVVVIGGIGLEFDWAGLAVQCLHQRTRSPQGCDSESSVARANAANSFLSWRSLLQQAHQQAPDANIVVVAPPMPVSDDGLRLGSSCCSTSLDGHEQVREVFDTATGIRRAVVDAMPEVPIILVETDEIFAGHRLNDETPWLSTSPHGLGTPTSRGADAIAERLEFLMPVGTAPEITPTSAEVLLILGSTSQDLGSHNAIANNSTEWLARFTDPYIRPAVAVLPVPTSVPVVPPPRTQETPAAADDSTVVEAPLEEFGPTAGRSLQDDGVVQPTFATDSVELTEAMESIATSEGVTSVADFARALSDAATLLSADTERHIVIRTGNLEIAAATDEALALLQASIAGIDAQIEYMATPGEQYEALTELLSGTDVTITSISDAELVEALPVLTSPVLRSITARNAYGTIAAEPHVSVKISATSDVAVEVRWTANGTVIAAGQRTHLPTSFLGEGDHEIVVVASTDDEQISTAMMVEITLDGDGLRDDACPNHFDPFPTDLDSDELSEACDDDDDGDGIIDAVDPCPNTPTESLRDVDLDGLPDQCDSDPLDGPAGDFDGDGFADVIDNCPAVGQVDLYDADSDGVGNACDDNPDGATCTITGTEGDDILIGTAGDDVICGLGGNDTIAAYDGADIVFAGPGDDIVAGGGGDDHIYGGSGSDELHGHGGADVILGEGANDVMTGGFGADVLSGGRGIDEIDGGSGPDLIFGGRGNDSLRGNRGADTVSGDAGHDIISGDDGNDLLSGGPGQDTVLGGRGDDRVIAVTDVDTVDGDDGTDVIDASPPVVN